MIKSVSATSENIFSFPIPFTKSRPVLTYGHNSGAVITMCRPSESNLKEYHIKTDGVYPATLYMIAIGY